MLPSGNSPHGTIKQHGVGSDDIVRSPGEAAIASPEPSAIFNLKTVFPVETEVFLSDSGPGPVWISEQYSASGGESHSLSESTGKLECKNSPYAGKKLSARDLQEVHQLPMFVERLPQADHLFHSYLELPMLAKVFRSFGFHDTTVVSTNDNPSLLFNGCPINSDENDSLPPEEKIKAVINAFGTMHAFFPEQEMAEYAEILYVGIRKDGFKELAEAERNNWYLTLLLAYQYAGGNKKSDIFLRQLGKCDKAILVNHLRTIELYRELANKRITNSDYGAVQELYELVLKTRFFPAAWLLVRFMMNNEGICLISFFDVLNLFSLFDLKSDYCSLTLGVYAVRRIDYGIVRGDKLKENILKNLGEIDLFLLLYPPLFHRQLSWDNISFAGQNISRDIFLSVCVILNNVVLIHNGLRKQRRNNQYKASYKEISDTFSSIEGLNFISYKKYRSLKAAVYNHHRNNLRTLVAGQDDELKKLTSYQNGFIQFVTALGYLYGVNVQKSPGAGLLKLINAAEVGNFPLLFKNAGDMYIGYGQYVKAKACYERLINHDNLPEEIRQLLADRISLCDEKITLDDNQVAATDVREEWENNEGVIEDPGTASKKEGNARTRHWKSSRHNKARSSLAAATTVAVDRAGISGIVAIKPHLLGGPDSRVGKDKPEKRQPVKEKTLANKCQNQGFADAAMVGPEAGATTLKQTHSATHPFYDDHPKVQRFLKEISLGRSHFDLQQEKATIGKWLVEKDICSRVFEEAAWFYIRQCISPMQTSIVAIKGDEPKSKMESLSCALTWLHKATEYYLQTPAVSQVTSTVLGRLLEEWLNKFSDLKMVCHPEHSKRVCALCSSFGHVYSEKATLSVGKKKHDYASEASEFYGLKRNVDSRFKIRAISSMPSSHKGVRVISSDEAADLHAI